MVATGSDDGYVGVWDSRVKNAAAGANIALLRPAHAQAGDGKEASPGARDSKPDNAACVTSLEVGRLLWSFSSLVYSVFFVSNLSARLLIASASATS